MVRLKMSKSWETLTPVLAEASVSLLSFEMTSLRDLSPRCKWPRSATAVWTSARPTRSSRTANRLNKSLHRAVREATITRRVVRRRGIGRRETAGGDAPGGEARRRIANRVRRKVSLRVPEGQGARKAGRSLRRVRRTTGMMRNRITLKVLMKRKSPLYLRTRIATDN